MKLNKVGIELPDYSAHSPMQSPRLGSALRLLTPNQ
jgi:hypothetical protein